jgi:LPS export ABC transporter protein LptC
MKRKWTRLRFELVAVLLLVAGILTACEEEQTTQRAASYKGPRQRTDSIEMILTDSARLNIRLTAPVQMELQNGDRYFPKNVFIEFYNKQGMKTTTLRANRGVQFHSNNLHTAVGNVIVTNLEKNQTLKTEKLNWNPNTQKLYTDQFVTIITPDERIEGTGLEAAQDFSTYRIGKISGVFSIEQ